MSKNMQKFYKRFDFLLNWLFGLTIICFIVALLTFKIFTQLDYEGNIFGLIVFVLLFINLFFGFLYIIAGIIFNVIKNKKKKTNLSFGNQLLLKGLLRVICVTAIFFLIAFILSFFSSTLPNYSVADKT